MGFYELLLVAVGLSMDAFAVAVCAGLTMKRASIKKTLIIGLYFGFFQAAMPIAGYLLAMRFADRITAYDHWITFALLSYIGGKMIWEGLTGEASGNNNGSSGLYADSYGVRAELEEASVAPSKMLPLAVATSIDALAVGVSFAFLKVRIIPAAVTIGITTFVLAMLGVKVGCAFGARFKKRAELAGGVILVLMGIKILLEHTLL